MTGNAGKARFSGLGIPVAKRGGITGTNNSKN
jgi:hypothetical protein